MIELLNDDTITPTPPASTDIERDRSRALALYENGDIGYHHYASWMGRLDHQQFVRKAIDESLAEAELTIADLPLARERDERVVTRRPNRTRTRAYGKFARSL